MFDKLTNLSANESAKALLGQLLVREIDGHKLIGRIVETESYHQSDPASHAYNGPTKRNNVMFGPAGYAYVYFTYGMHHCLNVVVRSEGEGAAVLIRALEPIEGVDIMQHNRALQNPTAYDLCSGPAKLCQAFDISREENGHYLGQPPLQLITNELIPEKHIVAVPRVGISKSIHKPLRFYIADNPFISKS